MLGEHVAAACQLDEFSRRRARFDIGAKRQLIDRRALDIGLGINECAQRTDAVRKRGDHIAQGILGRDIADIAVEPVLHPGETVLALLEDVEKFAVAYLADLGGVELGPVEQGKDTAHTLPDRRFDETLGANHAAQRNIREVGAIGMGTMIGNGHSVAGR